MPFPLVKLVYLFVRQVSKPIANRISISMKETPILRNRVLIPSAQLYHRVETNIKMNLLGLGKAKTIEPLSETMAVDLAADLLNDTLIFGVAAIIIWLEYKRSSQNSELERMAKEEEHLNFQRKIDALKFQVEQQNVQLRELRREMYDISDKNRSIFSGVFGGFSGEKNKSNLKEGEKEITLIVKSNDSENGKNR